jgi:hypothetical protein
MQTFEGVEVPFDAFLTVTLDGGEYFSFMPQLIYPQIKNSSTQWRGDSGGSRDSLNILAKRNTLPHQESTPGIQPTA